MTSLTLSSPDTGSSRRFRAALRSRVSLAVMVALLITACGGGSDSDASTTSTEAGNVATTSTPDTTPSGDVDAVGAADLAEAETPGAAIDIGQGSEGGQAVWEVVVRQEDGSGVEHYITTATGEVLKSEAAQVPAIASPPPDITIQSAMETALAAVGEGSSVVEADIETDGGLTVWAVLLSQASGGQVEVYVDSASGEVVKQERAD